MSVEAARAHNEMVLAMLEPGDAVTFDRGFYWHWALYKGERQVIHLAGDGRLSSNPGHTFTISGKLFNKAWVKLDDFFHVAGNSMAVKREIPNRLRTVDQIIATASSMLGKAGYNLVWNNCEHFVNYCITGIKKSDQVIYFMSHPEIIIKLALEEVKLITKPLHTHMTAAWAYILKSLSRLSRIPTEWAKSLAKNNPEWFAKHIASS